MGILDDAIREHLDLKRAHGAPEEEVRQKEAEAFGPVRHEAPAAAASVADEHTQLLAPEDVPDLHDHGGETHVAEPAPADFDALDPHHADADAAPPAAEAGAGTLEPSSIETGPPIAPTHPPTDEHPALVDHDRFHHEEHPPEPVFRPTAAAPAAPPDAPLEPAPVDDPPVGDPPVEHPDTDEPPPRQSPEQAHGHEEHEEPEGEELLEETPEFLQDAPEHDRLWFEQRPPRDFDFGE